MNVGFNRFLLGFFDVLKPLRAFDLSDFSTPKTFIVVEHFVARMAEGNQVFNVVAKSTAPALVDVVVGNLGVVVTRCRAAQ
jgi:hypothetical protein